MRLVQFREIPNDEKLRQQWNALARRVEQPQVFYTWEWSQAVHRAYRGTLSALLFLGYEGESLCGIAALASDAEGNVSFLCDTTADYCDFLSLQEHKPEFVEAVLRELSKNQYRVITLTNLPADSSSVAVLGEVSRQKGYHLFSRTAYHCAQVRLDLLARRSTDQKLELTQKKRVRYALNVIGRKAPVRIEHERSWEAIQPILPQFIRAHIARFLAAGRISNLARRERVAFLEELAKLLAEPQWVILTRMTAGSRVFAWNYGFRFEDTWFWYQPTFDWKEEKLSLGLCLLAKIIEEAAEIPALKTVDLGLGAEEYKEAFANQTRETLYVTLRSSLTQHAREALRYHTARAIKALPKVEAGVRAVLASLQRIKQSLRNEGVIRTVGRSVKRVCALLWSEVQVSFFEYSDETAVASSTLRLEPLDLNGLASAVSQYVVDDNETCAYLLRCTPMSEESAEGFAIVQGECSFCGFAWVKPFDGFFVPDLNINLEPPATNCAILFNCWIPASVRDRICEVQILELLATMARDRGQKAWVFRPATEIASVRELEKVGFQKRYSLVKRRFLGWQAISGTTPKWQGVAEKVSARV